MSNMLVSMWGTGSPPSKLSFSAFSQIKFWIFCGKKIEKNGLDIITVRFKDESITIDIVPQLKKYSTFHGV